MSADFVLCTHIFGNQNRKILCEALVMQQQVYTAEASEGYNSSKALIEQVMALFQADLNHQIISLEHNYQHFELSF
jgi:hypothetical protein